MTQPVKPNRVRVTLHYTVSSNGDGSYRPIFFTSAKLRDEYVEAEQEAGDAETCESEGDITFIVDGNGKIQEVEPDWMHKLDKNGQTFLDKNPDYVWRRRIDPKFEK